MVSKKSEYNLIHLNDLDVQSNLTLNPYKPAEKVPLKVNVSLYTNFHEAGTTDDLTKSINYAHLSTAILTLAETTKFTSFEELAQEVGSLSIIEFGAEGACIKLEQPKSFFNVDSAGIEITRIKNKFRESPIEDQLVLLIKNLNLPTIIGIHGYERNHKQLLRTSIRITVANGSPASADLYEIVNQVSEHTTESKFLTLEAFVEAIAKLVLGKFQVERVRVLVEKPYALRFGESAGVEVEHDQVWFRDQESLAATLPSPIPMLSESTESRSHTVLIGIGSNVGSRSKNIEDALSLLLGHGSCKIVDSSFLYETEPMYYTDQPSFLNAVIQVKENS
jgi:FolB domain-containing protein